MTGSIDESLLTEVADYYQRKLSLHGDTPMGVDWNGEESQVLRFQQLSKVLPDGMEFSVNDLGCGYGAFFEFLSRRHRNFTYTGIDVSDGMIAAASRRFGEVECARFLCSYEPDAVADFGFACGIFNVRLGRDKEQWLTYIKSTLDVLNATSKCGFAFNCLTEYSDRDRMREDLFYADPCELFDRCKTKYSRHVALLHDYGLYEFTILVRKDV